MNALNIRGTIAVVCALLTTGCAATQIALEHKDLDVQTQMSASIFLNPVSAARKTVWMEVKNTSDKEIDLVALTGLLAARGYKVIDDPEQANYRLQINVLYIGNASLSAIRDSVYAGWGGALGGAALGGAIGSTQATSSAIGLGLGIGGLVGGAAELIAGSLVKKVTFTVMTDVQLSEKSDKPVSQVHSANIEQGTQTTLQQQMSDVSGWRIYRTRVASHATKVNLTFDEAKPAIVDRLVKSLAGIL